MKSNIRIIFRVALSAFLLLWSCEDTTSVDNPVPGQVKLVDKSPDTVAVETGIDAEYILGPPPPRNGIIIQWHPVQDNDLVGYRVYRSMVDSSTALSPIASVRTQSVPGRIDTSYFDKTVVAGIRYYYRITAEDADQEGSMSKAADYQLEEVCIPNFPNASTNFGGTFQWQSPTIHTGNFIFRLSKESGFGTYESVMITEISDEYAPLPEWSLQELGLDSLEMGEYQWRIDIIGSDDNSGSESEWLGFRVQ